eukprot:1765410-Ditylum_brightwellii.AAC.1
MTEISFAAMIPSKPTFSTTAARTDHKTRADMTQHPILLFLVNNKAHHERVAHIHSDSNNLSHSNFIIVKATTWLR